MSVNCVKFFYMLNPQPLRGGPFVWVAVWGCSFHLHLEASTPRRRGRMFFEGSRTPRLID